EDGERSLFSYHEYEGLRDQNTVLAGLLAFSSQNVSAVVSTDGAEDGPRADVLLVSGTYFPVLGIAPSAGQVFGAEVDAARMAHPVVVVSDAFWRARLHADPHAIGQTLRIRRTAFTIVGVLPPSFTGLTVGDAPALFVPLTMQEAVVPGQDWLTQ